MTGIIIIIHTHIHHHFWSTPKYILLSSPILKEKIVFHMIVSKGNTIIVCIRRGNSGDWRHPLPLLKAPHFMHITLPKAKKIHAFFRSGLHMRLSVLSAKIC